MFSRLLLLAIVGLILAGDFRQALAQDDVESLLTQARSALEKNDEEGALRSLDAVIATDPRNQDARKMRGDLYYKKNDLDKAMADYGELRTEASQWLDRVKTQPVVRDNEATEQMKLARQEENSGQLDAALTRYAAIISLELSPQTASIACQNRGNLYHRLGETEKALSDYQEAIHLNPRNAGAYVNRGFILSQQGDHAGAIKDFDEALRFDPNLYQAYYNRALAYRGLRDLEKVRRDLDQAIKLNPNFAPAQLDRAALYAAQKQYSQAEAGYKKAIAADPTMAEPVLGLAEVAMQRGKQSEAVNYLKKALKLKPDAPPILNALGWIRATSTVPSLRDGREAVEMAMKACQLTYWSEFPFIDTLAAAYGEAGDFANAAAFQQYAMDLPTMPAEQRDGAGRRLRLYSNRTPYRDTARK